MPELPDVETFRRYVDATSLHQRIAGVDLDATRMLQGVRADEIRGALTGGRFEQTARRGKFLFVAIDDGPWLVLHFGMTGLLTYFKADGAAPSHTRLLVQFEDGYRLAGVWRRRLGRIDLAHDPDDFAVTNDLGPDAFEPELGRDALASMLRARRGGLKSALMDQSFVAGIGNVYSDEILFQAGLMPDRAAAELTDDELDALHRALRHVLATAIERQADPGRLPSSWLLPRREEGARCPRCGGALAHDHVAGRTAWYCPRCQC
jgi:formamidopyrimidine-DNA glycosylase